MATPPSSPPASTALAVPSAPSSPPVIDTLGDARHLELGDADPQARWVLLCPRKDTGELDGPLELATRRGTETLDSLVDRDATGRWLVISREGKLWLLDAESEIRTPLSDWHVDEQAEAGQYAAHRSLAFSQDGQRLAYLRQEGTRRIVVLRELETGRERSLEPGPGFPLRIRFAPGDTQLLLTAIPNDSNGNGRFDWPTPPAKSAPQWRCGPNPPRFDVWMYRGDKTTMRLASLDADGFSEIPGWIAQLGDAAVVRLEDGSLELQRGGRGSTLATKECQARVLTADFPRQRLLVACADRAVRSRAWWVGPHLRADTGLSVPTQNLDYLPLRTREILPLYAGLHMVLLDVPRDRIVELDPKDILVASFASRALVRRGTTLHQGT